MSAIKLSSETAAQWGSGREMKDEPRTSGIVLTNDERFALYHEEGVSPFAGAASTLIPEGPHKGHRVINCAQSVAGLKWLAAFVNDPACGQGFWSVLNTFLQDERVKRALEKL